MSDLFPPPETPIITAADSGCVTCKQKIPMMCTKDGDKPAVQGDGSFVSSYDPALDHHPDTLEEINKRIDDAMAPWEIFNGVFGGFDPSMSESDMNFGD
jgi:hypothetical protein